MKSIPEAGGSVSLLLFLASGVTWSCNFVDPQISDSGYQAWCTCMGGRIYNVGRTDIGCTPPANMSGGGTSGSGFGLNFQDQLMLSVFNKASQDAGAALGAFMTSILSGNRQQEAPNAQQRAQQEAWNAEARRQQEMLAAKQAQEREDRHQRLMGALKGLEGGGGLALKGESSEPPPVKSGTAFFGIPANPKGITIQGLQLKGLGEESAAAADPSAQMNAAAYLAGKGAAAGNPQDSHALFEAAYEAATGQKINFEIPPDVQGRPVSPEQLSKFNGIQKEYHVAQKREEKAQQQLTEAKYKKEIADKVRQEAEKRAQDLQKQPPPPEPEAKKAYDDKQAQANKLLQEATQFDNKATSDLQKAKEQADQAQQSLHHAENETHDYVKTLGRPLGKSQ